jgi:RNA polymerase sigma-70 factor, ECF subfamily
MSQLDQLRLRVLVLKCQIGDQAAWEELYRQYNPSLGYFLRRLGGCDQAMPDVQQDTWLAVFRNIAALKNPEAFTVWLYRIARNTAMSRFTARRHEVPLEEQSVGATELPDDEGFGPSDAAAVHAALGDLPVQHREVLLLRFMEELTYEQIAEVIGCGVGTVRSRIHYAKRAMRRLMENDHDSKHV